MINQMRNITITPGVRLVLVKSDKFKTDLVSVYLKRPLEKKEATANTLLARVLERGTHHYPTTQAFNAHLDSLYGASVFSDVSKIGELHVLQFKAQLPRSLWIKDLDSLKEAILLLSELIFSPATEGEGFLNAYVEQEKENLKQEIESRTNDKASYAVDRMIENMCADQPFSVYSIGDVTSLDTLDAIRLYNHYKLVLAEAEVDIILFGDFDFDNAESLCKEAFPFVGERKMLPISTGWKTDNVQIKSIVERMDVTQSKLVVGYRTEINGQHPKYNAALLFSTILGGTPSSRLFNRVREQESLCYYVQSKLDKFKGLMIVMAGIDQSAEGRVSELIDEIFEDLIKGNITEEELKISKKAVIAGLRSIIDYPNSFSNFLFSQWMTQEQPDIELIVEQLEKISMAEVVDAGRYFKKDTKYLLTGEESQ